MYSIIKRGGFTKKYIAGFDIDHTIIEPKSGNKFPKNKDDWKFLYDKNILNFMFRFSDFML